ncbi:SusC/RagA family TonB-linked outer membrane protein [Empedobacter sp. GD03739]|uniref:SusC/RagA family TonB-linked outer membrane protein n=1 Tax=Empedobacter sp. GD03739 TaxID=2975376 RepID=UPI00244852BC|nr:SusC/RagA family TonB-linked outer membrane protein [Empedobacter sp. GD03739]MDH1604096.1 SusC/RagA family TonB-linked outer membrane protein [Empedobacter sp. GD03739]
MRRRLTSLGLLAFLGLGTVAFAQVTGTVNDASNLPEADIEVKVKGTDKVTYTDENGNFNIDAKVGDTLVINGKEFKVTSTNLGTLNYSNKSDVDLGEVVVVGFGQTKTIQEITGATSTMSSKAIADVPVASVDKMLQGRVSGVQTGNASGQPGGMASVRVRGISSINGVTSPIWIVDGVRVSSGDLTRNNTTGNILASMNPDDIESVTVLKDAVSTAVYGADAGAGVIVITTKSGRKGAAKFNFSSSIGWNDRAVDTYRGFTGQEYKDYLNVAVNNYLGTSYTNEQIANGAINATFANIFKSPYSTNWQEETMKKGFQQNVDFNVSGANDKLSYYASANYFKQESVIKNSNYKRLAFTNKLTYQATDKLKLATDIQLSYSNMATLPDGGGFANPILSSYFNRPTDPAYNADGSYYWNPSTSRLSNSQFNPVALLDMNYSKAQTARIFANFKAEYDIWKNIKYTLVFAPEYINIEEDKYYNPLHGDGFSRGGMKNDYVNRYFNFNVQNILSWNKKMDVHNLGVSLIQEAYKSDYKGLNASGQTVGSPSLETLSNFVVPLGYGGSRTITSRWGYAATAHYDYDKLFLLDASYRRDILSQFMPGQKAGDFWSVGAGFDIARMGNIKGNGTLSMMKLRASYGKLGNQVSANPYGLYSYTTNYNDFAAAGYSGVNNPNLSWETVNPLNVGIDFGFLKDRIKFSAEYFHKTTKDLIYSLPVSGSQGLTSYTDNVGELVNKGFEFSLNADIFRGDRNQFNWNVGFNLSTLDNEITELYGGEVKGSTTILKEGEGVRTYYLRKWAGVDPTNGDPLWYINGKDGETTNNYNLAQQEVQGSFISDIYGGFNTAMAYKGFSLDLQFTFGFGGKIYDDWASYTFSDGQYTLNYPGYGDVMGDYWTPENTTASNPKPVYGGNKLSNRASTRFLYDADYIRLSNARVAYTFDSKTLSGSGLNSVQVFVMANNAWTHNFDDRLKFDPETNIAGYTNLSLPVLKSFLLGVNVSF